MYKEIFLYPAFFAYILLIIHSLIYRKVSKTVTFFGGCFIFGIIREYYYKHVVRKYFFIELTSFNIFGVPIAIPIGWTFTFYIGLFFAEKLLDFNINLKNISKIHANELYKLKILPIILVAATFSSSVSFAIESCALNMGWWRLAYINPIICPISLLFGWFGACIIFLHLYIIIQYKIFRTAKIILLLIILIISNIITEADIYIGVFICFIILCLFYKDLTKVVLFYGGCLFYSSIIIYLYRIHQISELYTHILTIFPYFIGLFTFCFIFIKKYRKNTRINYIIPFKR
ncbi:MAG: hypothetical protein ACTSRP_08705 [Candidatus Helarchaeota archaeon]